MNDTKYVKNEGKVIEPFRTIFGIEKKKGKREKSSKSKNTPKNLPLKTYVK